MFFRIVPNGLRCLDFGFVVNCGNDLNGFTACQGYESDKDEEALGHLV
jgi:hypothetical protein